MWPNKYFNKKVSVLSIPIILGDMELGVDKLPTLLAR